MSYTPRVIVARLPAQWRSPLIAMLLLCAGPAKAATGPADAPRSWAFRTFTTRDGLAHDIVRDVIEDGAGGLYFATMDGVTHYQPQRCSYRHFVFTGARRRVMALGIRGSELWAATQGGVGRLRGGAWHWFSADDGLPAHRAFTALLVDRRGRIWATPTGGGLYLFNDDRWRRFGSAQGLDRGEMGRCIETKRGAIICASYRRATLLRFDGSSWSRLRVSDAAGRSFYVHDLLEARDGKLWLATKGAGVLYGVPAAGAYRWEVPPALRIANNRVGTIFEAKDGSIWIATAGGVSSFDGDRTRHFSRAVGLGSSHVFAITQARDGALWFATLGGGVSRYGPSRWRREGVAQGLPSQTISGGLALEANGTLWAGTDQGLASRPAGATRWSKTLVLDERLDHIKDLLVDAKGDLWVATQGGLRRRRGRRWGVVTTKALHREPIRALAKAPDGAVWIASATGAHRFHETRWRHLPGPKGATINALLVDRRGQLWAATNIGTARLVDSRWAFMRSTKAPRSRTQRVYRLAEDARGRIWASGLDGVEVRGAPSRSGGAGKLSWTSFVAKPWLPEGIYSRFLMQTRDGSLWFAIRGLGVRRLHHRRWTSYSSAAGLAVDMVRDVLQTKEQLLFATQGGGVSVYRADRQPPQTFVGARPSRPPPTEVVHGEPLLLPFCGQDVLKDTPTAQLQYSWRLDAGRWTAFSLATRAQLRDLSPGSHVFEVRAMDRDLNLDPTPALHRFVVVRPWYREPWFWTLLLIALAALAYAGLRVVLAMRRERRAIAEEQAAVEQRKRFVRLASHELRKPLTRLAHRAEMLAMPEMREQESLVERYANAIQGESKHLARLVESLLDQAKLEQGLELDRQPHDLRALLAKLMRELGAQGEANPTSRGSKLGAPNRDVPTVNLPEGSLWAPIDPLYVQLALRNLLDNAQKYGGPPGGLEVTLALRDERLIVTVQDGGPGIAEEDRERIFSPFVRGKTSPVHGGFGLGLPFARDIARAHGGDLVLKSPSESESTKPGACFVLTLPALEGGSPPSPERPRDAAES